jgi:hypothetical protein
MKTIIDCQNCQGTGQVSELVSVRVNDTYVQDSIDTTCNVIDCVEGRIEVEVDVVEHYSKQIVEIAIKIEALKLELKSDNCEEIDKVVKDVVEWLLNDSVEWLLND